MLQCTLILRKPIIIVLTKNFSLKVFVHKSTTKGEGYFH